MSHYKKEHTPKRLRKTSTVRSNLKTIILTLLSLLLAATLVTGAMLFVKHEKAVSSLNKAIEAVVRADNVIIPLDKAINSEFSKYNTDTTSLLMESSVEVKSELDTASDNLDAAELDSFYLLPGEKQVLSALYTSVDSRRDLMDIGKVLLSVDQQASNATLRLENAYDDILNADEKMRHATDSSNEYAAQYSAHKEAQAASQGANDDEDPENDVEIPEITVDPQASVKFDTEALALFKSAKDEVEAAGQAFDVDYSVINAYLDARIEATEAALELDTAVAQGDYSANAELTEEYNTADEKATELAVSLPAGPSDVIGDAYEAQTSAQHTAYLASRQSTADSDTIVRDYRNIEPQSLANTDRNTEVVYDDKK